MVAGGECCGALATVYVLVLPWRWCFGLRCCSVGHHLLLVMAVVLILLLCWSPLVVGDGSGVDTVALLVTACCW